MHRSYIILSQLWRLFINTNQFPPHLVTCASAYERQNAATKKYHTHEHKCTPQIKKGTHLVGCPSIGLRTDLHMQTKKKYTHSFRQQIQKWMHALSPFTNTHKQTNVCVHTHALARWHAHILQLIGRQVSGEEEKNACSAHTGRICNFLQLSLY